MSEFPDTSSVTGRVGALTVIGEASRGWGWTFNARYVVFRAVDSPSSLTIESGGDVCYGAVKTIAFIPPSNERVAMATE